MKHRHSFFIDKQPIQEFFELVNGKNGQPSVVKIRHLSAAREWKTTIDVKDLEEKVRNTVGGGLTLLGLA